MSMPAQKNLPLQSFYPAHISQSNGPYKQWRTYFLAVCFHAPQFLFTPDEIALIFPPNFRTTIFLSHASIYRIDLRLRQKKTQPQPISHCSNW